MALVNIPAVSVFLLAILPGIMISMIYDFFCVFRVFSKNKSKGVFVSDLLFMFIAAIFMFLFLLATNYGVFRFYIFFSASLGFLLYRMTIGQLIIKFLTKIIVLLLKICRTLKLKLFLPFAKYIFKYIKNMFRNIKILFFDKCDQSKNF